MTEVRDGGVTLLAQYAYDPLSRLTTTTYDNGAQTSHDYELDNDLTQVAQSYGVGSVTFDYLYNLVNQRTDTSIDDNAYLWFPDLGASNSYLSNELNQYDDVDGTLFTYDGNGNLTGDGADTYLYDVESRLISATTAQNTADYSYDPQGRRGEKDVDGTVTRYVYAGDTVIAEYDGLDQLQARYVPGPGIDRPVLMDRGGTLSYYHYDGSGSVIAMTDAFGTVAESYAFGPYGESADGDALSNPYRYTGRRLDAETGLYYYRARYYSVTLGRFLQADPAGYIDGLNLYAYVRNDPLNLADPTGKWIWVPIGAVVGAGLEVTRQLITGEAETFGDLFTAENLTKTAIATGTGALGGGLGSAAANLIVGVSTRAVATRVVTNTIGSGIIGLGGQGATDVFVNGELSSAGTYATAFATNAAAGAVGSAIGEGVEAALRISPYLGRPGTVSPLGVGAASSASNLIANSGGLVSDYDSIYGGTSK